MNIYNIRGISTFLLAFLPFLSCSLPGSIEPAQWKMHVEIPVINQDIPVGNLLRKGAYGGFKVGLGDSIILGDTISVTKTDSFTYEFEQLLQTSDCPVIIKRLGSCKLSHLPPVDVVFPLISGLQKSSHPGESLSYATTLSMSRKGYELSGVQSMTIDECSPACSLSVANLSGSTDIDDIVIAIMDNKEVAGVVHTASLPAGTSKTVSVSIAGKQLQFPVALAVCATLAKGMVMQPSDLLRITFSLNGQIVSDAEIEDSLIDYTENLSREIVIADSFRVDRFETGTASLGCEISCPALLKMEITGSFVNILKKGCPDGGVVTGQAAPPAAVDTRCTIENFMADTLFEFPGSVKRILDVPLRPMCLFPSWNPVTKKSTICCNFRIRSIPDGRLVHFNKDDTLTIRLLPLRFPLVRVDGCLGKKIGCAHRAKIKAGLAATTMLGNSLQRSLRFQSARLNLDFNPGLPPGSMVDSLLLCVTMKDGHNNTDSAVTISKLVGIASDSRQSITMDFTGVFNLWPDTLTFDTRLMLSPGTSVSFLNTSGSSVLKFNPAITWMVTVPLCWRITDTARIEPKRTMLSLDTMQLRWARKLQNPRVKIVIDVQNQTNVGAKLYALGAAADQEETLTAFPDSLVGTDGFENRLPVQLFTLFNHAGLCMAPRSEKNSAVLQLDERGIAAFLSSGRFCIRWFLLIPSKASDALHATDFCTLRATGIIDGVGNTDTLSSTD